MRIVTGLQDTQYFEPETAMDWTDEESRTVAGVACAAASAASASASTAPGAQPSASPASTMAMAIMLTQARSGLNGDVGGVADPIGADGNGHLTDTDATSTDAEDIAATASAALAIAIAEGTMSAPSLRSLLSQFLAAAAPTESAAAPGIDPVAAAAAAVAEVAVAHVAPTAEVDAPAAAQDAPATTTTPATPPPSPAAVPAVPAMPATVSTDLAPAAKPYVGEPPIDPAWWDKREPALLAVRAEYSAARSLALSHIGNAPGWIASEPHFDEQTQRYSLPSGWDPIFVADPNAQPEVIGQDESGLIYKPVGLWWDFDEARFNANFQALEIGRSGSPFQSLAAVYGVAAETLLTLHPDVWNLIVSDHALNAGSGPAGQAMASETQLGFFDIYMADPSIELLMNTFGGIPVPGTGGVAGEQMRLYGPDRYLQLSRLGNAMQAIRDRFSTAFTAARDAHGIGWIEVPHMANVALEDGSYAVQQVMTWDEGGNRTPVFDAVFDAATFTQWYESQPGLEYEAFAEFYGAASSVYSVDDLGHEYLPNISFDNPDWMADGNARMNGRFVGIDPNHAPRLVDETQVGFDPVAGWITSPDNLYFDNDHNWFEKLMPVAMVILSVIAMNPQMVVLAESMEMTAATVVTTTAGEVVTTTGLSVAGLAFVGGIMGGTSYLMTGVSSGNLTVLGFLKAVFTGALTPAILGDLKGLGAPAAIAERTLVQGGVAWLVGEKFKDGALAGFLAELGNQITLGIDAAAKSGALGKVEVYAARTFGRLFISSLGIVAHPESRNYALANFIIDQVMQKRDTPPPASSAPYNDGDIARSELIYGPPVLAADPVTPPAPTPPVVVPTPPTPTVTPPPWTPTPSAVAFDDDGNLMPGIVDPSLSFSDQQNQLTQQLLRQGLTIDQALDLAQAQYDKLRAFDDAFVSAQAKPQLVASTDWSLDVRTARDVINAVETRIASGAILGGEIANSIDDVYEAYMRLTSITDGAATKPTIDQEAAAKRLVSLIMDLGELAKDQHVELSDVQARLVDLARTIQIQGSLPVIYGAAASGGILGLRQSSRIQAQEAWAAKPYLRSPESLIGQSDGGPGIWRYSPSRSSGQDYQEQITGVPRNIEYQVNGRDFDGYDVARNTLLDSKHWDNYPPADAGDWWKANVTKEGLGQLRDAEGTGARIEWQVSTTLSADKIRQLFLSNPRIGDSITVVVTPKKP